MEDLIRRVFASCTVQNGIVNFGTTLSQDEIHSVYTKFTADLLNCNIPHNRVVGFAYPMNLKIRLSMFKANPMFNKSAIELGISLGAVVPAEIGGNDPQIGCYYNYLTDVDSNPTFDRAYGNPTLVTDMRKANALTVPHTLVGQLKCAQVFPPLEEDGDQIENEENKVTTDNMWYMQSSLVIPAKYPEMLLPHKEISDLMPVQGQAWLHVFYMNGTGRHTYEENQTLFREDWPTIVPCATEYDLSKFFTCRYPDSTNCLKLTYLEDINENVLQHILRSYGLGENT